MSYTNVKQIVDDLKATTKRTDKDAILASIKGSDIESLFKYVCHLAYDPTVKFYTVEFDPADEHVDGMSLMSALKDAQNILATRTLGGNMARQWLTSTHGALSEDNAEIFKRVIEGDLKCGIQAKSINKHWPNLIYDHPYMRCSSFNEKNMRNISFPCYSQTKMDGLYVDIIVNEDSVEYRSRNGSFLPFNDKHRDQYLIDYAQGLVLQGEAVVISDDGSIMLREDGNGYINSDEVDVNRVHFYVWDAVTLHGFSKAHDKTSYESRYAKATGAVNAIQHQTRAPWINVVDTVVVNSVDEVISHFKQKREAGEEGTVVKDKQGQWKYTTSKHQVKVKVVFDCELQVIDWKQGTGKNEGKLGALICRSADEVLEVSVGGGYKQKEREDIIKVVEQWVDNGQIITVRANDVIESDQKPGMKSLFLPRFVEARKDKTEADDLTRIREQLDACMNVLQAIG